MRVVRVGSRIAALTPLRRDGQSARLGFVESQAAGAPIFFCFRGRDGFWAGVEY